MSATILIRVTSHRSRDKMRMILGDIGLSLKRSHGMEEGEFYAVSLEEAEKVSKVKGIRVARIGDVMKLSPAWSLQDDAEIRRKESQKRLDELIESLS